LRCLFLKIGVFHPNLNTCGGGEWVTLNIIKSLRKKGHKVVVLTDEKIDQAKFTNTFGEGLQADSEIMFPFHLFKRGNPHNIYTDIISCLILKSKCQLTINTFSDLLLPADITYMQNVPPPPTERYKGLKNKVFFLPYQIFERKIIKNRRNIVFSNSKFTLNTLRNNYNLKSYLLYPPLSSFYLQNEQSSYTNERPDQVVTISRFAPEKGLEIIPHIAKQLHKVKFFIVGNLGYRQVYLRLLKLIKDLDLEKNVVLMANVPKDQLRQILLNSKICLHCASNEAFGISLIEGMACGCLPIAYDAGGPKEIVPQEFRFKTIDEATRKIRNAIKDWTCRDTLKMRDNSLKFSQETFSEELLENLYAHGLLPRLGKR
jgi:glycosyltransferase involved in cell wall biosynthesis